MAAPPSTHRKAKHRAIYQSLHDEIMSGQYGEGHRLPGEAELVERFGASRPTVSRALYDLQQLGLIERRAGSGTYIRLPTKSNANTGIFGLIIPGLGHTEIFGPICAAIAAEAQEGGYSLLWGDPVRSDLDSRSKSAEKLCTQYLQRNVSGVFFAPLELTEKKDQINHRIAGMLKSAGVPVVLLDRDIEEFPLRSEFDLVGIDNLAGGYMIANHLLKQGCTNIRFVARPASAETVDERIAGARELLARRGMHVNGDWVLRGDPVQPDFIDVLVASKADALICANDETAALVLKGLLSRGIRVPEQIKIAGFDDVRYATLLSVPLTTVHQPCRDIGAAAMRAMVERIANPSMPNRRVILQPSLVERESTAVTH